MFYQNNKPYLTLLKNTYINNTIKLSSISIEKTQKKKFKQSGCKGQLLKKINTVHLILVFSINIIFESVHCF